jgi:thiol-disulfide isomerase/thioredoxin
MPEYTSSDILSNSNTLSSVQLLNKENYINIFLGIIVLFLIIILLFNFCGNSNKKNKKTRSNYKDTIVFYLAEWCPHCKKIKPFIKEKSKQSDVKFIIIDSDDISDSDKNIIRAFPTALRKSDNKIVEGEIEIKKLINETLNNNIFYYFTTNDTIDKDTITFYVSNNCSYCQKLYPYIEEYKKQSNINIVVINDNELTDNDNIEGFPTAIRKSDGKIALGNNKIIELVNETLNNNNDKINIYVANWCPYCQNLLLKLEKIKRTNIEIIESKDISKNVMQYIKGFPTAIRQSDNKIAVGEDEILELINNKTLTLTFIYSLECKYSKNILPLWLDFKRFVIDNKLNINTEDYDIKDIENLTPEYKNNLKVLPTLFVNNEEKYEGYDDIKNYLENYN